MLGIAARSSIATPTGALKGWGAISVRKMAIPIATGTAMAIEIIVLTTVPKMAGAPPNFSIGGFQTVEVINFQTPNVLIAREDSL